MRAQHREWGAQFMGNVRHNSAAMRAMLDFLGQSTGSAGGGLAQ